MTTRINASRASAAGASTAAESTLRESTPPAVDPGLRVLFLDVDGVVCCNDQGILEPDKMGHLARIVRDSKCVVCLSTNWRLYDDLRAQLCEELAALNIECVGTTPDAGAAAPWIRSESAWHGRLPPGRVAFCLRSGTLGLVLAGGAARRARRPPRPPIHRQSFTSFSQANLSTRSRCGRARSRRG